MKKLIAVLLSLSLALTVCAVASAATYTADGYYAITYPDELQLDNTTYASESAEGYRWLFDLANDEFLIEANVTQLDQYADFSLSNADESDKQFYFTEVGNTFADYSPEWLDTVTAESGLVFYIFHLVDSDGPYLYAEAIENGLSANFVCYYFNRDPDDALLETLKSILNSIAPPEA